MEKINWINYLVLPKEATENELKHVKKINKVALGVCIAHIPLFLIVAYLCGTSLIEAAVFGLLLVAGPAIGNATLENPRTLSLLYGFTSMGLGALLVHLGSGPVQIEMHFHFFASLALLTVWGNPLIIWVATVTVAAHHGLFWFFLPDSVFNYNAEFWVVAVHAAFVVVEAIAASYIARNFYDNVIGLEKIIEQKTKTIRNILDNVPAGLFVCEPDMKLRDGFSRSCEKLLNVPSEKLAGNTIPEIFKLNSKDSENYQVLFEQVIEDYTPEDMNIEQLPSKFQIGDTSISLSASAIRDKEGTVESVLYNAVDITNLVKAEKDIAVSNSLLKILQTKTRYKYFLESTIDYIDEMKISIKNGSNLEIVRRYLHTIKGNLGVFGLTEIYQMIHEIEGVEKITLSHIISLEKSLQDFLREHYSILGFEYGKSSSDDIAISNHQLSSIEKAVSDQKDADKIRQKVIPILENLKMKSVQTLLGPIDDFFLQLADRMEKSVNIQISGSECLIPEYLFEILNNLTHLFRNSLDHGIEKPSERQKAGKPYCGIIQVNFKEFDEYFSIVVSDDGGGINVEKLKNEAISKKIISVESANKMSNEEAFQLVFNSGLTTSKVVTDVSGRGIGMSSVLDSLKRKKGTIKISSILGQGTTISIEVPKKNVIKSKAA